LREGVPLLGFVQEELVILVRRSADIFAVGATCTHYGGPLAEGLVVDDTVAAHGTMPASICRLVRLYGRRP
jgi:nitrite reductase/ring-hydroxylating ferredoxin subunit